MLGLFWVDVIKQKKRDAVFLKELVVTRNEN